jgi:hypothetical protein
VTGLGAQLSLHLLGPFRARRGEHPASLPRSAARVLAYLAIHSAASRQQVSGALWPDVPQARASSDLRTALWRLQRVADEFLLVGGETLAISEQVAVDVQQVTDWATRTVAGTGELPPPRGSGRELLPGWDEEWLEDARERIRLLTVQALESCSRSPRSTLSGRARSSSWSNCTCASATCTRRCGSTGGTSAWSAATWASSRAWDCDPSCPGTHQILLIR